MRRRRLSRRSALAGAVAIALAPAAAGCGRQGALTDSDTTPAETPTSTTPRPPLATSSAADTHLRNTAVRHARKRFGVATRSAGVTLLRSRVDPAWAITSAADGRTLWVVWLRDGEVALATTNVRAFNPRSVPCDLRPAFSEPSC